MLSRNFTTCLTLLLLSSLTLGAAWTRARESVLLAGQEAERVRQVARDISQSWPSYFSISAPGLRESFNSKVARARRYLSDIYNKVWGEDGLRRDESPRGYLYAGKRAGRANVEGRDFSAKMDCLSFSPGADFDGDCRAMKAGYSKHYFQEKYLPALREYRELRKSYRGHGAPKPPKRLASLRPRSEQERNGFYGNISWVEDVYDARLSSAPRGENLLNDMKSSIVDEQVQTGLVSVMNPHRDWGSGNQYLLIYKVESCYVRAIDGPSDKRIPAYSLCFVDLDPYFTDRAEGSSLENALHRLFFIPKEDAYSFDMDYRRDFGRLKNMEIQNSAFISRGTMRYAKSRK